DPCDCPLVAGWRAPETLEQRRALKAAERLDDLVLADIGRQQHHILQRLSPDAAEPDYQHRPPLGIAPRAHDHLETGLYQTLDQHAIEPEPRLAPRNVALQHQ